MGIELKEKDKNDVLVLFKDMKRGEFGVILDECVYHGEVVLRLRNMVVSLSDGNDWKEVENNSIRVKILPSGTELVIK